MYQGRTFVVVNDIGERFNLYLTPDLLESFAESNEKGLCVIQTNVYMGDNDGCFVVKATYDELFKFKKQGQYNMLYIS